MRRCLLGRISLALRAAATLLAAGCTVDAPPLHHADERSLHESKYFVVEAPTGDGWEARVEGADLPFLEEPSLFVPFVPVRISFVRHEWRELWPHSLPPEPALSLWALPAARDAREAAAFAAAHATQTGVRDVGGLRWTVFADRFGQEWVALDAGVELRARLRVPGAAAEVASLELARVVAGVRRRPRSPSATDAEIERGAAALWELAGVGACWGCEEWSVSLMADARRGAEALTHGNPERPEGPLFIAALALLEARRELLQRRGGSTHPLGPFDTAFVPFGGPITTTALSARYDAASVCASLREALRRAPDAFWARYHLGLALAQGGERAEAERELAALARRYEHSALAWFALALVQRDAGDARSAIASAEHAKRANRTRKAFEPYGSGFFGGTLIDALLRELRR